MSRPNGIFLGVASCSASCKLTRTIRNENELPPCLSTGCCSATQQQYIQFFISSGLRFSACISILITSSAVLLHVLYSAQTLS